MIPIQFEWTGDFMVPLLRFQSRCDQQYVVGQVYRLVEEEERSHASHAHYFACLTEAWRNLPESIADRFPTAESLRKWCLIKTGFADVRSMVYETANDAKKAASFLGLYNEHAVIIAKGCVVSVYIAKSQSTRAMDKATFQASKTAVLDLVSSMIGVSSTELAKQVPQPRQKGAQATEPVEATTETTPSEPAPQAVGPSIPVPSAIHAPGTAPPAVPSPPDGTGAIRMPESASEYIVYAEYWISKSPSAADAYQRWDNDMGLRDELQVPIKDRNALLRQIEETFGART